MKTATERQCEVLKTLCDLPTAPFQEGAVISWLRAWAAELGKGVETRSDAAGNLYVEYVRGERSETPVVVEAHMDHPGFMVVEQNADGIVRAEFRGGVKPSYFVAAMAKFWIEEDGRWAPGEILEVKTRVDGRVMDVWAKCGEQLKRGTLGMWDLPDAQARDEIFSARVCDDLAGCAAIVCLLEELVKSGISGHIVGLFSRAEEVGFAGVLAVCMNGWIAKGSLVIGLEMSKETGTAKQGEGPIVRVGDRTGLFSAGLTHFLTQAAGFVQDENSSFKFQRALMDGGMCSTTALVAWGYDAAAMCLALRGYHNMEGLIPSNEGRLFGKESTRIVSESIHLADFAGMVRILVEAVKRIENYKPGFGEMRERLTKLHNEEHLPMLYNTAGTE